MIFATVGTHEDPFDRLVEALNRLQPALGERVVIQSGYTKVPAPSCELVPMMDFAVLQAHMAQARVIITHGGPASIMQAFAHGKVPVVVPRQSAFGEHVDDHQVRFATKIQHRIVKVVDIADLADAIARTPTPPPGSNGSAQAEAFAAQFDALCEKVLARPNRRLPRVLRWAR